MHIYALINKGGEKIKNLIPLNKLAIQRKKYGKGEEKKTSGHLIRQQAVGYEMRL